MSPSISNQGSYSSGQGSGADINSNDLHEAMLKYLNSQQNQQYSTLGKGTATSTSPKQTYSASTQRTYSPSQSSSPPMDPASMLIPATASHHANTVQSVLGGDMSAPFKISQGAPPANPLSLIGARAHLPCFVGCQGWVRRY